MQDILIVFAFAIPLLVVLRLRLQGYAPRERSLLNLSLGLHILFGALLVPLMKGPLKGGDLLSYDNIAQSLLDRLFRTPGSTLSTLMGLLLHSGDPLPVPDYGLSVGSSGSMIAFTTLGLLITFRSLPAACVLVAAFSFLGKLRMYDVFRAEIEPGLHRRVIAATTLVPSTIFWSSGLIKEAFATIGLGLVFKELYRVFYRRRLTGGGILTAVIGSCLMATTKAYLFVPLGLGATASVLLVTGRQRGWQLGTAQRLGVIAIGIAAIFAAGRVSSQYDPANFVEEAGRQQTVGAQMSYAGSYYSVTSERSLPGQIAAAPLALITALFRPFIFEARNAQSAANGVETLFFTFLTARAFRNRKEGYRRIREQPIFMFCCVFSVIMAVGVGLASTNLGTLSRYRMPMMPFLWVLVTIIATRTRSPSASLSLNTAGTRAPLSGKTAA